MQLGRISDNHSADMHQVTKCLHDHSHSNNNVGKMGAAPASPSTATQQIMQTNKEQQTQLTLNDWIRRLLQSGKQRLLGFWNGSETPSSGDKSQKTSSGQTVALPYNGSDRRVANASDVSKEASVYNSPYFAAVPTDQPQSTAAKLVQKIKLKCSSITGQLAKHLPGKFSMFQKKGSFHAKKDGNHEDLRRRSKYREDKLEIDCVLTDESYLLDSYDRKGEYTQLTTKK